jgi:hypothetical protein
MVAKNGYLYLVIASRAGMRAGALVDLGACQHAAQIKVEEGATFTRRARQALRPRRWLAGILGLAELGRQTIQAVQSLRKQFHS